MIMIMGLQWNELASFILVIIQFVFPSILLLLIILQYVETLIKYCLSYDIQ